MQRFYPDYESIHSLTLSLDYHKDKLECTHCSKNDQFISHGNVYKQRSSAFAEKVGKRLFCSNRFGRTGCGRTFQLYVATEVPSFRYGAAELFVFITAILASKTIAEAYVQATNQTETRNAWRWLNRLMRKLSDYRTFLKVKLTNDIHQIQSSNKNLIHLLPTLARLFTASNNGCFDYQMSLQKSFF